jgi:hypothetical protein
MNRENRVERPRGKSEYTIYFDSSHARNGWGDLVASRRTDLLGAWEFLTHRAEELTGLSYPLRGSLGTVTRDGVAHTRRQLKLSKTHGARIWYFVVGDCVYLEKVFTRHPNETE